jgi:hypothetical protein
VLGFVYNAATVDGRFGLMANGGPASFDDVLLQTNDRAFVANAAPIIAATALASPTEVPVLQEAQLQPIIDAAIARLGLNELQIAKLKSTPVVITDLPGTQFGAYADGVIWIDVDAAGYGWFVDTTPATNEEYQVVDGALVARSKDAIGRIDLLSVLTHEYGHVLGLEHTESGLMAETLEAGVRSFAILDQGTSTEARVLNSAINPSTRKQPTMLTSMGQSTQDLTPSNLNAVARGTSGIIGQAASTSMITTADRPVVAATGSARGSSNGLESESVNWLLQRLRLLKRLPFRKKS